MTNFNFEVKDLAESYKNLDSIYLGLSNEELAEIINGDSSLFEIEQAYNALLAENVLFCIDIVSDVTNYLTPPRAMSGEDLLQEAVVKMCDCMDKYDPSKAMFTTYYEKHVRRHVESVILTGGYVAISDGTARKIRRAMAIYYKHRDAGINDEAEIIRLIAEEMKVKKFSTIEKYIQIGRTGMMAPSAFIVEANGDDQEFVDGEAVIASDFNTEEFVVAIDTIRDMFSNSNKSLEEIDAFSIDELLAS